MYLLVASVLSCCPDFVFVFHCVIKLNFLFFFSVQAVVIITPHTFSQLMDKNRYAMYAFRRPYTITHDTGSLLQYLMMKVEDTGSTVCTSIY